MASCLLRELAYRQANASVDCVAVKAAAYSPVPVGCRRTNVKVISHAAEVCLATRAERSDKGL
jgi:hypothetical protein